MEGYFFNAADLQALALFDSLDVHARFHQRVVCAGVEPCETPAKPLQVERTFVEVKPVEICDFQLTPLRGSQRGRELRGPAVVEVESCNRIIRLRCRGLFLDAHYCASRVELRDAVALRVADPVAEDRCAMIA